MDDTEDLYGDDPGDYIQMPQPGDRVRITGLMDDPQPIEVGTEGTVTRVRAGQISVNWDSGRRLILLDTDPFEVLQ